MLKGNNFTVAVDGSAYRLLRTFVDMEMSGALHGTALLVRREEWWEGLPLCRGCERQVCTCAKDSIARRRRIYP
jgi:hypothetical protein